jgi:hypothetical protein
MMIPPSPLKCIRAGGSQGCVGSFVLSGFFFSLFKWVFVWDPLYTTCIFRGAMRCLGVSWRSITL